jgi:hypothetical protein
LSQCGLFALNICAFRFIVITDSVRS